MCYHKAKIKKQEIYIFTASHQLCETFPEIIIASSDTQSSSVECYFLCTEFKKECKKRTSVAVFVLSIVKMPTYKINDTFY